MGLLGDHLFVHACAKVNLGLRVLGKREDGYHDLETLFLLVPDLSDTLLVERVGEGDVAGGIELYVRCGRSEFSRREDESNLVVGAYRLMRDRGLPSVRVYLTKRIPAGAGLGGGSSDGAAMLRILSVLSSAGPLGRAELFSRALALGSDVPFFLMERASEGRGRGERLTPIANPAGGDWIRVVCPAIFVSTAEAFGWLDEREADVSPERLVDLIRRDRAEWQSCVINDFQAPVFSRYPILHEIVTALYEDGAYYASMSGSGPSIYGLYDHEPSGALRLGRDTHCEVWTGRLRI